MVYPTKQVEACGSLLDRIERETKRKAKRVRLILEKAGWQRWQVDHPEFQKADHRPPSATQPFHRGANNHADSASRDAASATSQSRSLKLPGAVAQVGGAGELVVEVPLWLKLARWLSTWNRIQRFQTAIRMLPWGTPFRLQTEPKTRTLGSLTPSYGSSLSVLGGYPRI